MAKSEPDGFQIGCTIIFIIVFLISSIFGSCDSKKDNNGDKANAWVKAQYAVEAQLKSPSTAKFPWAGTDHVHQSGNIFMVRSYVDSQNSFGAMVRTYFVCKIEYTPEDKKYKVLNLAFYSK
jgi:hypothetical protein